MDPDTLAPGLPPGLPEAIERAEEHADELFGGRPSERYVDVVFWADGDFAVDVAHTREAQSGDLQYRREHVRYKASHGKMVYALDEQRVYRSEPSVAEEEVLETWHPPGVEPGSFDHHEVPEELEGDG